jgi:hypothetical protein
MKIKKNKKDVFTDRYSTNRKTHHLSWEYRHKGNYKNFLSITHSPKDVVDEFGNHLVIELIDNPNPNDKRQAYVVDYTYVDRDDNFKSIKKNYKTSKGNKKIYQQIIDRHKSTKK